MNIAVAPDKIVLNLGEITGQHLDDKARKCPTEVILSKDSRTKIQFAKRQEAASSS